MSEEDLKEEAENEQPPKAGSGLDPEDLAALQSDDLESDEWIGEGWDEVDEEEEEEFVPEGPQFVDNGDQTISDSHNNLMWAKQDSYAEFKYGINWFEANDYIESLNDKKFGGFDDWRLCSLDEAKSMFSFTVSNRDKDGAEIHIDLLFEGGGGYNNWTYEEKPDYQQYAMIFSYVTGNEKWENKDNEYCHVRAVRDELKEEWEPEWRSETKKFD